jgi:hypothetical protein
MPMSTPATLTAGQALARNIAPLAGILFLGWNARNVLYLYFLDTLLSMAVILAGVIRHQNPPAATDGWAARLNGEAGILAGAVFGAAILAVPLGVWLVFMLDGDLALRATFADAGFRSAAGWQALAALWSYATLADALRTQTPDTLHLKRRFTLVFLRWIALIFVSQFVAIVAGILGAIVFVAAYAAIATWTEIAPDHFLRTMPGGTDPAETARPAAPAKAAARKRRKRQDPRGR